MCVLFEMCELFEMGLLSSQEPYILLKEPCIPSGIFFFDFVGRAIPKKLRGYSHPKILGNSTMI